MSMGIIKGLKRAYIMKNKRCRKPLDHAGAVSCDPDKNERFVLRNCAVSWIISAAKVCIHPKARSAAAFNGTYFPRADHFRARTRGCRKTIS